MGLRDEFLSYRWLGGHLLARHPQIKCKRDKALLRAVVQIALKPLTLHQDDIEQACSAFVERLYARL
jgi:hypothetical protein